MTEAAKHVCGTPEFSAGGIICYACRAAGVQDHICDEECFKALAEAADNAGRSAGQSE